jgi:hypothetical protein
MKCAAVSLAFVVFTTNAWCIGSNSKPADITGVADAGAISKDQYRNGFFNLVVDAPDATLQLNPVVDKPGQRARLLQVLAKPAKWDDTYTFAVLADALGNYPQLQSAAHYVRSVRHQLEKEGMPTVRDEFAIVISGIQFSGTILQEHIESGRKYYRGLFATFRNGYILSFDVEAASPDKVKEMVTRLVRFETVK